VPLRLALPMVGLFVAWPVFAFDAIYAFGDSLTDTSDSPEPATNYFQGPGDLNLGPSAFVTARASRAACGVSE